MGESEVEVIVCGLATVDIVVRPVPLSKPLERARLWIADNIKLTTGGLVSNSGLALARWGIRTVAMACLGNDSWADVIRKQYQSAGLATTHLIEHPTEATSATIVLVDPDGERSFIFETGASACLDRASILDRMALFSGSRWMLYGYYSLFPELDRQLAEVLSAVRSTGCRVALDTAGSGGSLEPLREILPHVDLYLPNLKEATHQTGSSDPLAIFSTYRDCGATGIIGLKLGDQGAILSPSNNEFLRVEPITPPEPVLDTTGAGDAFNAGLLAGLLRGFSLESAGRIAAAAGSCCVTELGATAGLRDWKTTCQLAKASEV